MGTFLEGPGLNQLSEVALRCNPYLEAIRNLTWKVNGGTTKESWQVWLATLFEPLLLPHLVETMQASACQSMREVVMLDRAFDHGIPAALRDLSTRTGKLLLQYKAPRGDRMLARLHQAVASNLVPGHFATLYAVRAAAFSIPVRTAVLAYLLQELSTGCPAEIAVSEYLEGGIRPVNEYLRRTHASAEAAMHFHG